MRSPSGSFAETIDSGTTLASRGISSTVGSRCKIWTSFAVASCFCKLMGFERFENCVADVGLRENSPARRVTLFVDFFDYALGVLDQVIMATIRDAGRNPRKKSFNRALLLRMRLGQFFARKLDVDVSRAGQPQGCRQIDRQRFRTSIWFGRSSEPDECAKDRDGETPALHLLSIA